MIASSSFILLFHLYWYSYIIVCFVCDSASEFGGMDSTSIWGFSYPNLLVVFLNLLFFRNLFIYFICYLYWYSSIVYFVCDSKHAVGTAGIRRKNICAKRRESGSFLIGLIDGTIILHLFTYILLILVNLFNFSKGGGVTSSLFILFIYLYWYFYIVYFVCDSASEFGAMGSIPFFGSLTLTCFVFF